MLVVVRGQFFKFNNAIKGYVRQRVTVQRSLPDRQLAHWLCGVTRLLLLLLLPLLLLLLGAYCCYAVFYCHTACQKPG